MPCRATPTSDAEPSNAKFLSVSWSLNCLASLRCTLCADFHASAPTLQSRLFGGFRRQSLPIPLMHGILLLQGCVAMAASSLQQSAPHTTAQSKLNMSFSCCSRLSRQMTDFFQAFDWVCLLTWVHLVNCYEPHGRHRSLRSSPLIFADA